MRKPPRFQQLPVFSKRIEKIQNKNKITEKNIFLEKKKNTKASLSRESIERDKCGMFVRNIFSFLKSDEREIRDARARERESGKNIS